MEIQDYLIAAVQNLTVLAYHSNRKPVWSAIQRVQGVNPVFYNEFIVLLLHWVKQSLWSLFLLTDETIVSL
jgi:hypothetical protein